MYRQSNFRKINDHAIPFNLPDNPGNACANCLYFRNPENDFMDKICTFYNFHKDFIKDIDDDAFLMEEYELFMGNDEFKSTCDYYYPLKKYNEITDNYFKRNMGKHLCLTFMCTFAIIAIIANILIALDHTYGFGMDDNMMRFILLATWGIVVVAIMALRWSKYQKVVKSATDLKQSEIKLEEEKIEMMLSQPYVISFSTVYNYYNFSEQELIEALKDFPYHNFKVTESQIIIDNHYRIRFLNEFASRCNSIKKEKESANLNAEIEKKILPKPKIYCDKCGEEIVAGKPFCPSCGSQLPK